MIRHVLRSPPAAARAAGQAATVAHMLDHAPHAATYAAKAIGLHHGDAARAAERHLAAGTPSS